MRSVIGRVGSLNRGAQRPIFRSMAIVAADPLTVLLVEDSRPHAQLVEDMLDEQGAGMRLIHRARVADAERVLCGADRPDCVLMDLGLPDAEGLDAVRRLVAAAPETPLVVLSGQDDEEIATQAVQQGAQDYLVKARSDGYIIARAIRYAIERKRAQIALTRHASEVQAFAEFQRDFVAAASHELRTPLTSILGYIELLMDEPDEPEAVRAVYLQAALRNSHRLLQLIEDLLTVNRMETSALPIEPRSVRVDELAGACLEDAAARCAAKGLEFDVDLAAGDARVLADPERMAEVLDNLLGNAVKFTPAGGRIALRTRVEGGRGVLDVEDTGMGIASEDLPRIFDRFYRSARSIRLATPGTGLGLAIALSLVEAQDGVLGVRSEPGAGSTFTVGLPLEDER